jgi:uroporphyrinogen decarboxylase
MTTPRENLLRTLRRQGFEWVPVESGGFCPAQVEAFRNRFGHDDIAGWFGNPARYVGVPMMATWREPRALYPRETLPADCDLDAWGIGHSRQPDCWHMTRMHHPLRGEDVTLAELRAYPMPVVPPEAAVSVRRQVADIQRQGFAAMGGLACTVWETAWYLRSMEDLMTDMITEEERAAVHLDRVTNLAAERMRILAGAGADLVQLGDDIGMQSTPMMSLPLWRRWLKPRLAAVVAAGREVKPDLLVFYHSCGFVLPFLEELAEIGIDILNPVQPECMAFTDVHARIGGRMSFWGTIGTQSTLPFGAPQEVKEAVWTNLRRCGAAGGIVIAPTHLVEPEVPWANLVAMKEAAAEFRP